MLWTAVVERERALLDLRPRVEFARGAPELGGGPFVPIEAEGAVLDHDLAEITRYLEAVRARRFTGGRDEDAGRAGLVLEVGGHLVFDLDVVKAAEAAEGTHARRHAEEPLPEVYLMRRLVQEHAPSLARPRRAPASAPVVGRGAEPIGDDPVDAAELAEIPSRDQLLELRVARVGALIEHLGEDLALFRSALVSADHSLRICLVHGERLLHQHRSPASSPAMALVG